MTSTSQNHTFDDWAISCMPDHGELCYLPWNVQRDGNNLNCSVTSRVLPLSFSRNMVFEQDSLTWQFEASNIGPGTSLTWEIVWRIVAE